MGLVVTYSARERSGATGHEVAARGAVAPALAALKGYEFAGGYEPRLRRNSTVEPYARAQ